MKGSINAKEFPAFGTAVIVIIASYILGAGLFIMGWLAGGNIAAGGLIRMIGTEKLTSNSLDLEK